MGENFFQVDDPVVENDIEILCPKGMSRWVPLFLKIRRQNVSLADKECQDIAKSKDVVTINIFPVPEVEIEIDPAVLSAVLVYQDMVASYVSVFFAMRM